MPISADTRTTSATTLQREFESLSRTPGWTSRHEALAQGNAAQAYFTPRSGR
ncbi:hypothetical protein [Streptomyces sp. NPDC020996]|uniref:hypothetical protein n=1 Tax=Streptomyces sp. NPDC020996 TaxID=3154791 RepID=UPI0033D79B1A